MNLTHWLRVGAQALLALYRACARRTLDAVAARQPLRPAPAAMPVPVRVLRRADLAMRRRWRDR